MRLHFQIISNYQWTDSLEERRNKGISNQREDRMRDIRCAVREKTRHWLRSVRVCCVDGRV